MKPANTVRIHDAQLVPHARRTNPFATRFVRPGAIPFQFEDGTNPQTLVEQLASANWRGAIVGPHGSGKSTLLATLIPCIQQAGRPVKHLTLCSDGTISSDGSLTSLREALDELQPNRVLIVDGWEQLNWLTRYRIRKRTARQSCGLLVTAHDLAIIRSLPLLFQTTPSLGAVQLLVEQFLQTDSSFVSPLVSQSDVATAFREHRGNIRDAFFALYDLCERRTHSVARTDAALEAARV